MNHMNAVKQKMDHRQLKHLAQELVDHVRQHSGSDAVCRRRIFLALRGVQKDAVVAIHDRRNSRCNGTKEKSMAYRTRHTPAITEMKRAYHARVRAKIAERQTR